MITNRIRTLLGALSTIALCNCTPEKEDEASSDASPPPQALEFHNIRVTQGKLFEKIDALEEAARKRETDLLAAFKKDLEAYAFYHDSFNADIDAIQTRTRANFEIARELIVHHCHQIFLETKPDSAPAVVTEFLERVKKLEGEMDSNETYKFFGIDPTTATDDTDPETGTIDHEFPLGESYRGRFEFSISDGNWRLEKVLAFPGSKLTTEETGIPLSPVWEDGDIRKVYISKTGVMLQVGSEWRLEDAVMGCFQDPWPPAPDILPDE